MYYGTIDASPLWVCLLHDAWRWGMPETDVRALANQGWKDSRDAIRFSDGRIAAPPVTLCEVQGYAHQAAMNGAELLDAFGQPGGTRWRAWAADLATAFRSSFWVAGRHGPYPALALDRAKRQANVLTSNIAHLLGTGLLSAAEEGLVAERLSRPDMNSGFGLRTMSAASGGYSPLSYHCGTVWSHDTAIAIAGLARGGHQAAAALLADGLLEAASAFGWRLPELFSGHARAEVGSPVPYPAACRPQAWAAAAAGALIQAVLGLDVDVPAGTVHVRPLPLASRGTRAPLHVTGLVAGQDPFSAGTDADGTGYVSGLPLALASRTLD